MCEVNHSLPAASADPRRPYEALTLESAPAFAAPHLSGVPTDAEEIGDGNLNLVFRVRSRDESVIVKQALPYLRVAGEAWPLTRHRARIEAEAILVHDKLVPGCLPSLRHFDNDISALVLEDLHPHIPWREALIAGDETAGVAARVGRYSADVLLGTSHVSLSSRQRRELHQQFIYSELCLVTEDLVFTAPYHDAESNRYDDAIAHLAASIRTDKALRSAAAELRFAFRTRDEALIHGDLHTGSVMVGSGEPKVIDLEFAFFGPFGFDPGVLLANLALAFLAHSVASRPAIADRVAQEARDYWDGLVDQCRRSWDPAEPWLHQFLAGLVADAGRFAGMEMIRRIVGLAHAKDIDVLPDDVRHLAQSRAIGGGRALVLGRPVQSFEDLWQRAVGEES